MALGPIGLCTSVIATTSKSTLAYLARPPLSTKCKLFKGMGCDICIP